MCHGDSFSSVGARTAPLNLHWLVLRIGGADFLHCWVTDSTVEPVYYGHLGTSQKCPDYQGVLIFQVSLHDNVSFGTTARCVDYAGVHIFKCPD